jgi:hypothetical protein
MGSALGVCLQGDVRDIIYAVTHVPGNTFECPKSHVKLEVMK